MDKIIAEQVLIDGDIQGPLLVLDEPISFWGGVDVSSGRIVDRNHPQCGESIAAKVLVLPGTRGSTASPGALLEALAAGTGPCAVLLTRPDNVCLVAASMCSAIGLQEMPVFCIAETQALGSLNGKHCIISSGSIHVGSGNDL